MNAYISKKKKRCNQCTKKSTQEFLKTTKLYPKKVERRQTEKKKKRQSEHTIEVNKAVSLYFEMNNKTE